MTPAVDSLARHGLDLPSIAGSTGVDGYVHPNAEFDSQLDAALNGTTPSVDDLARVVGGYQPYRNRYRSFIRVDRDSQLHCGGSLERPTSSLDGSSLRVCI
jgi:hypothetical protein